MIPPEIKARIERELQTAEESHAAQNEARARVCARRAAGYALQAYYTFRGDSQVESNAYSLLRRFQEDPNIPSDWKMVADLLLTKVNKDYSFPAQADVLAETRRLIQAIETSLKGSQFD